MNLEDILSGRESKEKNLNTEIISCYTKEQDNGCGLREYVVTLHNFEDLDNFYDEMQSDNGDDYIPDRSVERTNKRPLSRNTHYILTKEEAEKLKEDPRVWDVDLTMEEKGIVAVPLGSTSINNGVFARKSAGFLNTDINWGLLAHSNPTAVSILDQAGTDFLNSLGQAKYSTWGSDRTGNATASTTIPFNGENVDVVIVDDEIPVSHPEFAVNANGTGGSRVNEINWWSLYRSVVQSIDNDVVDASVPSTYNYGNYGDHGTHVAGICAGNRLGWARKANIYSLYAYDTTKVPPSLMYDLLRAFHLNKPVNGTTGRRNPTITNHSYGYVTLLPITQITQVRYRGSNINVSFTNNQSDLNILRGTYGLSGGLFTTFIYNNYPTTSSQWCVQLPIRGGIAQQADIEDAISNGIVFVSAAGNYGDTSVSSTHPDYNNSLVYNYQSQNSTQVYTGFIDFYKRGTDPAAVPAGITVGNIDSVAALKMSTSSSDTEQVWIEFKVNSSSHGNTCDVWAAGTNILSSVYTSQTLKDPRNNSFSLNVLSGTSMASPQVAGMIACLAERYPRFKQSDFLSLLRYYGYTGPNYNYSRTFPGFYHKHYVTNTGSTSYEFTSNADRLFSRNGSNQNFDIRIGEIVEFSINTPGQPFWIKTLQITGTGNAVTTGITNNGATSGSIIWDTTNVAPGTYYYISQNSSIMTGTITLKYSQLDRAYTAVDARTQPYVLFPTTLRKTTGYISSDVAESPRPASGLTFPRKRIWQTGTVGGQSSSVSTIQTYSITPSTTTISEGSTVTFNVTTNNVPNGTTLYWTTVSTGGNLNSDDFIDLRVDSSFLINNGNATISRTLFNDTLTEGVESFYLEIRTNSITGPVVATSPSISINDTSITPTPTYNISQDRTSVNEGSSIVFTLTTTNVPNGTTLYWTIGGNVSNTDFTDFLSSSSFLTTNNSTTITRTLRNDITTEGAEIFNLQIRTGSISGPVVATSSTITVNDTSTSPTYNISPSTTFVNEGSSVFFTITTTNVPDGTTLSWRIAAISGNINSNDFTSGVSSGTLGISSNTGSVTISVGNDLSTEGNESFVLEILSNGVVVATSSTITINDTSLTPTPAPTVTLSASPSTITRNNPEAVSSSVLSWNSTNATDVISSNFGATSVTGSTTVSPFSTTNYSISVSGPGGTANSNTTVNVNNCVVPSGTSSYGSGFSGYLWYGNGEKVVAPNGSSLFINSINSLYGSITSPITTAGGVVTTYTQVANVIINHYTSVLSRYPESLGFDYWFYDFLNFPGYTSFNSLIISITTSYNQSGGERDLRASKGGLIGNYDSCNNRRV